MTVKDSKWWIYEGEIVCASCVADEIGNPLIHFATFLNPEIQPSPTVPDECGICGGDGEFA